MNFFEHQEQSRRHTRWLIFLFVLALLAIIAAVQLALMLALQWSGAFAGASVFSAAGLREHAGLLAGAGLATGSVVGLASLFKTLQLRGGGGEVARQLGGVKVDGDTRDPLKRRLYNVVEEIAIASGTPVPEVYVLERESGINAFAAGYSSSDAAVAVTRGTLEKLNRSELQGVIAHEFSHILNGDMRINIRLMGALFGILLLALIGRRVLFHARFLGRSRDRNGAPVIAIALVLMLVGYVGLFFGRWIKSSVSRAREYLADASAVQFTRNPEGIAGALKKIAIYNDASWLQVDSEEVGHMLFGPGQRMPLFATHPPLLKRIERIEPGFREQQLQELAEKIKRDQARAERREEREQNRPEPKRGPLDAAHIIEQIGNPDTQQLLLAASVAAGLAAPVRQMADSPEQAPGVLLYSLLDTEPGVRDRQLLVIAQRLGAQVEEEVRALVARAGTASPVQRLPLLEIALPNLRRQPPERVRAILQAADEMIRVDGRVDVFEYLLARMVRQYLWESVNPQRARLSGRRSLQACLEQARIALAVLAVHGHTDDAAAAAAAYAAGCARLPGSPDEPMPEVDDWVAALDQALARLDDLGPDDKQRLVHALLVTVTFDQQLQPAELELLRATAAAIHVPVPVLSDGLAEHLQARPTA